jgi:hypothetical protein
MVRMTAVLFEDLNEFLGDWNPIGVPQGLALDEYKMYVPLLLDAYNKGQTIESFLIWMYEQQIGYDVNELFLAYTIPLAGRITHLLQAHEE